MKRRRRRNDDQRKARKQVVKYGASISQFHHFMELPEAILHEILLKLPINSITKLRLLCKPLYNIISDPYFAANYTKIYPFSSVCIPVYNSSAATIIEDLDLIEFSDNYESFRTTFTPKFLPTKYNRGGLFLVGACNGMLCLRTREEQSDVIYIYNPITGECKNLPARTLKDSWESSRYAFGFCSSTNNYKVLRLDEDGRSENEIFTIGTDDTWRVLTKNPSSTLFYDFLIFLNGFFHSIVENGIHTFDIREEKIGLLSYPHGLELLSYRTRLTSTNNQLCIVDVCCPSEIVIWKMKEYGVADSWTKDVIIDSSFTECCRLELETILLNGNMIFSDHSEGGILYDPIKRKVTKMQLCTYGYGSINYTPNLLSLREVLTGGHTINKSSK